MKLKDVLTNEEQATAALVLGAMAVEEREVIRIGSSLIEKAFKYTISLSTDSFELVEESDIDWVVYQKEGKGGPVEKRLLSMGFIEGGSDVPEEQFTSYKKGRLNFIVCHDWDLFGKYSSAQSICTDRQIVLKEDRVAVFDFIMDREGKCSHADFADLAMYGKRKSKKVGSY